MGISILELVLQQLREADFQVSVAFPGQVFPQISETVATAHIEKVDRANLTVTVEVTIIAPASVGGTACEVEALRATEVLRWAGAECVQNGCCYDGVGQVYTVAILASFTCITEKDDCTMGPGFTVYIDEAQMEYAISFQAEMTSEYHVRYAMGESAPVDSSLGPWIWKITLEELVPAGSDDTYQPADSFTLRVDGIRKSEQFSQCRWTSIRQEYTKQGMRRIQTGIALLKEEKFLG